jgi:hypothetical protein
MERLFSKHVAVLRSAAGDDIERKVLTCGLLRVRILFLWAALPLVIFLVGISGALLFYYIKVIQGKASPVFFLKIIDIFSLYTGSTLVLTVTSLFFVGMSDYSLRLLSSFRSDEGEHDDPAAALPPGPAAVNELATNEIEDLFVPDLTTPSEIVPDTQSVLSLSVCENAG